MNDETPKILVVGSGISGIRSALTLAELGFKVCLVEKASALGGILPQLDYQFPNNHCGMCRMLPMIGRDAGSQFCLKKGLFHENITIFHATEVLSVDGSPGRFSAFISRRSQGVGPEKCTDCGKCMAACPVTVSDSFNAGIGQRKAIYVPVPYQVPGTCIVDWDNCTSCGACVEACPENAITLDDSPERIELDHIAAVVLATGTPLFDAASADVYGGGHLPNVVAATAFERILSSSGPYQGAPVRPSDGKPIKKVAWVQCVGSRNVMINADYCSNACCMFAVKEAVLAKEKLGQGTDTAIFYMDMRTFGRDFQRYRDRAEKDQGVRFVRCRVHSLESADSPGDVLLSYVDPSGEAVEEVFDMVVLSTGQTPDKEWPDFASDPLNREGFVVCDSALWFKDIAGAVIDADAAAGRVARMVRKQGGHPFINIAEKESTQMARLLEDIPHVLVIMHTGGETPGRFLDWDRLEHELKNMPGRPDIAHIRTEGDGSKWAEIVQTVIEGSFNRLILVGFNSHVFRTRIRELEKETGIFGSLIEVVDLQRAAALDDLSAATGAAVQEIEMALRRLLTRTFREDRGRDVMQTALVIGGGPAGLSAAAALAEQDIDVTVVEQSEKLGGNLDNIHDPETRESIEKVIAAVENHTKVTIQLGAEVLKSSGVPGEFHSIIRLQSGAEMMLRHGATIIAIGGRVAETAAYNLNAHERIISHVDLEKRIYQPDFAEQPVRVVVMIQCAGSREEPRNYCSRTCCLKSLKNAIRIKKIHPEAEVYVFYRDIMAYGESEKLYTEARGQGIMFLPFDVENKPVVLIESDGPVVQGFDQVLGAPVRFEPDWVSLAVGVVPNPTDALARIFGVKITEDGFIKEADSKWRPVDMGKEGVFVCGLARAPARLEEAMREGEAAAQRALRILARPVMMPQRVTARVRHAFCSLCEMCIQVCPYDARQIDAEEEQIRVDPAACQGCGACASVCPNSATVMDDFEDNGIMDAIEAAL